MGGVVFFFPVFAVTLAFQVIAGGQTRLLLPSACSSAPWPSWGRWTTSRR